MKLKIEKGSFFGNSWCIIDEDADDGCGTKRLCEENYWGVIAAGFDTEEDAKLFAYAMERGMGPSRWKPHPHRLHG